MKWSLLPFRLSRILNRKEGKVFVVRFGLFSFFSWQSYCVQQQQKSEEALLPKNSFGWTVIHRFVQLVITTKQTSFNSDSFSAFCNLLLRHNK